MTIQAMADSLARLALSSTIFLAWTCSETLHTVGASSLAQAGPGASATARVACGKRRVSIEKFHKLLWYRTGGITPGPSAAKAQLVPEV